MEENPEEASWKVYNEEDDEDLIEIKKNEEQLTVREKELEKSIAFAVSKKSVGVWQPDLELIEIKKIKGNYWKKMGISKGGKNYLYPEEAIMLFEKKQVLVSRTEEDLQNNIFLDQKELYETMFEVISLPSFLTYSKLKELEYIPVRTNRKVKCFYDDVEIIQTLGRNPLKSLKENIISYDLYLDEPGFTKSSIKNKPPVASLMITNGEYLFSQHILLPLIDELNDIPLIIAVVTASGEVFLEEFANAEKSIHLTNLEPLPTQNQKKKEKKRKVEEIVADADEIQEQPPKKR